MKIGENVVAFESETTTHAAIGIQFHRETEKSTTNNEEKTMMKNQTETSKTERNFKLAAMILAAFVMVAVVEEQAC